MQHRSPSVAPAREHGKYVTSLLAGIALELLDTIYQVVIRDLGGKAQGELVQVREDEKDSHTNTTKALDHTSVHLDSNKKNIPCVVVSDEVAQLQRDSIGVMDGPAPFQTEWIFGSPELLIAQKF